MSCDQVITHETYLAMSESRIYVYIYKKENVQLILKYIEILINSHHIIDV